MTDDDGRRVIDEVHDPDAEPSGEEVRVGRPDEPIDGAPLQAFREAVDDLEQMIDELEDENGSEHPVVRELVDEAHEKIDELEEAGVEHVDSEGLRVGIDVARERGRLEAASEGEE